MQSLDYINPRLLFGAAVVALVVAVVGIAVGWGVIAPLAFLVAILLTIFGMIYWTTPPSAFIPIADSTVPETAVAPVDEQTVVATADADDQTAGAKVYEVEEQTPLVAEAPSAATIEDEHIEEPELSLEEPESTPSTEPSSTDTTSQDRQA